MGEQAAEEAKRRPRRKASAVRAAQLKPGTTHGSAGAAGAAGQSSAGLPGADHVPPLVPAESPSHVGEERGRVESQSRGASGAGTDAEPDRSDRETVRAQRGASEREREREEGGARRKQAGQAGDRGRGSSSGEARGGEDTTTEELGAGVGRLWGVPPRQISRAGVSGAGQASGSTVGGARRPASKTAGERYVCVCVYGATLFHVSHLLSRRASAVSGCCSCLAKTLCLVSTRHAMDAIRVCYSMTLGPSPQRRTSTAWSV